MRYVVFLRAINTGNRRLTMSALRSGFEGMGFLGVSSHLASGNVILESPERPLRSSIEEMIETTFGFTSEAFVRSEGEVGSIIDRVPWDPASRLVEVSFLEAVPDPAAARALEEAVSPPEALVVSGREVYFLREGKGVETTHKESTTERILGMRSTRRGMATIIGIADKHLDDDAS